MKTRKSPAEIAALVWLAGSIAGGLVLVFSGSQARLEVWVPVLGAAPALVAFLAAGGLDVRE